MPGNLKYGERANLRDKKGRPYYLANLPYYKRNPKAFIAYGSIASALIFLSAPIYKIFFANPDNYKPEDFLWPSEIKRGKTNRQRLLEKYCPEEYEREMSELQAKRKVQPTTTA